MADEKFIEEHHRFTDPPPKYQEQAGPSSNIQYPPAPNNPVYIPPPTQITYITQQQTPNLRDRPVRCTCPSCRANIVTHLNFESGIATWLISGGLCLLGLGAGCCLIPFCVNACKDVEHHCPNCRAFIGRFRRV